LKEAVVRLRFCILASIACLSGCADLAGVTDPYQRAGTWKPSGANEANLRAMVADPADLVHGRGDNVAMGQTAAVAVERLRAGKIKRLPDSGVAEVKVINNGAPAGDGATQ
jgi:type IV pilus biogenesis protein CpaD/CtpE